MRYVLGLVTVLLSSAAAAPSPAATFRWASNGDVDSMDPYSRNESFLLMFLQNIYEPLVRRDRNLAIEPALATHWEQTDPLTWRFHLRQGVRFQGNEPFTADDVIFSYHRASTLGSQTRGFFSSVTSMRKVDDFTVDVKTATADPVLLDELSLWVIMSRTWCEAHSAEASTDLTSKAENFATRHADGTGPFSLVEREPDRRTVLRRNPNWWDKAQHNLTDVEFDVVSDPATEVAALLSGQVDMIYTVPPQDVQRLSATRGVKVIQRAELRTIFLGFDQARDTLLKSDVAEGNPFKDRRVRQAFNMAINADAIDRSIMRGEARPTGLLYGPGIRGYTAASNVRYPVDPARAKALLAEAGYPSGFGVTLDCPNDRYVNDEAICVAVTNMLARVGVRVTLNAQPRMQYFAQVNAPAYHTSFFMLGWTPYTYDAENAFYNLAGTRDGVRGIFNDGGYSNPAFDTLVDRMAVETRPDVRDAEIIEASKILHDDAAFVPLHQQTVVWAARSNVEVEQLADDSFPLRYVVVK